MNTLIIYTKFCLPCIMEDFWQKFQKKALEKGIKITVIRTTYQPSMHQKASEIWGGDGYTAFGVFENGKTLTLERIMDMWTDNVKNKRVAQGKNKQKAKKIQVVHVEKPADKIKVEKIKVENK